MSFNLWFCLEGPSAERRPALHSLSRCRLSVGPFGGLIVLHSWELPVGRNHVVSAPLHHGMRVGPQMPSSARDSPSLSNPGTRCQQAHPAKRPHTTVSTVAVG